MPSRTLCVRHGDAKRHNGIPTEDRGNEDGDSLISNHTNPFPANEREDPLLPHAQADVDGEFWVLTTEQGHALLAMVNAVSTPRPVDLGRWRKLASFEHVSAAIRLAETRRRGAAKFDRADEMWFDSIRLEQSTSEAVARHKARRFSDQVVFDLCCGIGGDAIALAEHSEVVAVDLDPGTCRRAAWNAEVYGVAGRLAVIRGDVEAIAIPSHAYVHVDPDRRALTEKRAKTLDAYQPGLEFLRTLAKTLPGGAFKLGPASDFDTHFRDKDFEVELISLGGECKEAAVWFGGPVSCHRRATSLPTGASWTDRDGPVDAYAGLSPILAWIYDADPSLARAGLLDGFAKAHRLTRFVGGIDFLTSESRVVSPFLAAFEVVEVLPMDRKILKRELAARAIGTLEIKTKGVEIRPEGLRRELQLEGPNGATLLIAGGEGPATVILARRARD